MISGSVTWAGGCCSWICLYTAGSVVDICWLTWVHYGYLLFDYKSPRDRSSSDAPGGLLTAGATGSRRVRYQCLKQPTGYSTAGDTLDSHVGLHPNTCYRLLGAQGCRFWGPDEARRKDPAKQPATIPLCLASETVHELCRWPFPSSALILQISPRPLQGLVLGMFKGHESMKTHPFFREGIHAFGGILKSSWMLLSFSHRKYKVCFYI